MSYARYSLFRSSFDFEEIFDNTIQINMMENESYERTQQKIIDFIWPNLENQQNCIAGCWIPAGTLLKVSNSKCENKDGNKKTRNSKLFISICKKQKKVFRFPWQSTADVIEQYKHRTGHYPERILADKIYRNRNNLAYCKERSIRLSGPALVDLEKMP